MDHAAHRVHRVPPVEQACQRVDRTSSTITRLKATWWEEYEVWRKRDLKAKRYVYIWADGVYFTPRLDGDRQCMLVIIGADEYGEKDVLAIMDGFRENADSWRDLLKGLKKRGLTVPPELAIGDGALGFWTALREVFPDTREQRCWVHKTANVLGAMPKSLHEKAKADLQDIWMAETKKEATAAFDLFVETYGVKYEKAVGKLAKEQDAGFPRLANAGRPALPYGSTGDRRAGAIHRRLLALAAHHLPPDPMPSQRHHREGRSGRRESGCVGSPDGSVVRPTG